MSDFMETATAPDPLDGAFTGSWLMAQNFPPTRYVVDGLIPEGFSLLVAAPKIGKSWMVLGLAVATATGGDAFGTIPVRQAPVLYLALEDGPKRLQRRLRNMGVADLPGNITFLTTLDGPVLSTIGSFLDRHAEDGPLVILDTLGKVMPPARMGQSAYHADYSVSGGLRDLVGAYPGAALMAVHHTRKQGAEDFTQATSGTQGLTGGADTILVLTRNRHDAGGTLQVTSRDAAEGEYAVTFHSDTGTWSLDGTSLMEAAEEARQREATKNVGDPMAELVAKVSQYPEGTKAGDLAVMLGWDADKCGRYLRRAADAGRIAKIGRGLYTPVRSVRSVRSEEADTLDGSDFRETDTTDTADSLSGEGEW
ncbi:hypothetical protein BJF77_12010 [Kocuria sp. CNJ-770]|uniref:AAA family ATPase n=1 Tax=Kocuria sp. CNJ-770 TaxID=1904964 RepID=UPI00095AA3BC|nr:AAA family ATPase [Kocuria sp. CNJ-770]OLT08683.1 hypothetical protein BJF77_12010 [Kocuria sp. CNJ-770]